MSDWKPGRGQRIDALYAWVAVEPDGGEGICSMTMHFSGRPVQMPMVGADMASMESLRPHAERVRRMSGYPIKLVRFAHREDLEELP